MGRKFNTNTLSLSSLFIENFRLTENYTFAILVVCLLCFCKYTDKKKSQMNPFVPVAKSSDTRKTQFRFAKVNSLRNSFFLSVFGGDKLTKLSTVFLLKAFG